MSRFVILQTNRLYFTLEVIMEDNRMICSHCGAIIEDEEQYETINGNPVCSDCVERYATYCDHCGAVIWTTDAYGDDSTTLCESCYNNYYTHCHNCGDLVHENDAYHIDGYDYCSECYSDEMESSNSINEYSYKPTPIFYGSDRRYFGVELEIDEGGKDSDYADELLEIDFQFYTEITAVVAVENRSGLIPIFIDTVG